MSLRVTTGKVRLCFPHLFEPYAYDPEDEPKYSAQLLIPKSDRETLEKLRKAEAEAATEAKAWGGKAPKSWTSIISDGDQADLERFPEREGNWVMSVNANKKFAPQVVDRNVQAILDQTEVYSGVYARVSVTAFTFDFNGKKGVGFALGNVQILGGGSNLGGGAPASADFDEVEGDDGDDLI